MSEIDHSQIRDLIAAYCDGRLDDASFAQLQQTLRDDPGARRLYRRYMNLDAALRESSDDSGSAVWNSKPAVTRPTVWIWGFAGALAAAIALSFVVFFPADNVAPETMAEGFAVLTETVDVKWSPANSPHRRGDTLTPGHVRFESGVAQIEFFGGATVILEGNVDFEIVSATEAFLHSGKARATAPPAARGFVIRTPDMEVVDLGTEFAIDASPDGSEIHVFDGEVEFSKEGGEKQLAKKGQAFSVSSEVDHPHSIAPNSAGFTGVGDLENRSKASAQRNFERWQAYSQELRRDPRLITYYSFDQPGTWERVLRNSQEPRNPELDGAIVGAARTAGRWDFPKSALEFKRTGSRVRLFVPGEFSSMTLTCWARIDSLDRQYNALYLTDSYQPGEVHWQIGEDGRILFSILVRPDHNLMSWSPKVWDLSQSGRWMHLAAVFDESAQEIRHYVDGQLVLADPIPKSHEIHETRLGPGEIGNWGLPTRSDPWFAVRNLNGLIDEFAIFSAALDDAEIREMFNQGNPY